MIEEHIKQKLAVFTDQVCFERCQSVLTIACELVKYEARLVRKFGLIIFTFLNSAPLQVWRRLDIFSHFDASVLCVFMCARTRRSSEFAQEPQPKAGGIPRMRVNSRDRPPHTPRARVSRRTDAPFRKQKSWFT